MADVQKLQRELDETREQLKELQGKHQFVHDLNVISPFIANYYTLVYHAVRKRNPGIPCQNWAELMSAASAEEVLFDEYEIDSRPVTEAILAAMNTMGNMTESDWKGLQLVRKHRNALGHPRGSVQTLAQTVKDRWSHHEPLAKLAAYMESRKQ